MPTKKKPTTKRPAKKAASPAADPPAEPANQTAPEAPAADAAADAPPVKPTADVEEAPQPETPAENTPTKDDAREKALNRAAELGIEGAADMESKQLAVAIEEAETPRITVNVPQRVVTLKGIVVEAGQKQVTEFELQTTGLLPHQYERLDDEPGND